MNFLFFAGIIYFLESKHDRHCVFWFVIVAHNGLVTPTVLVSREPKKMVFGAPSFCVNFFKAYLEVCNGV